MTSTWRGNEIDEIILDLANEALSFENENLKRDMVRMVNSICSTNHRSFNWETMTVEVSYDA